jgi:hypothetical protein
MRLTDSITRENEMADDSFKYMVIAVDVKTAEVTVLGSDTMPAGKPVDAVQENPHGGKLVLPKGNPMSLTLTNPCSWFYDGHSWYKICT